MMFMNVKHNNLGSTFVMFGMAVIFAAYSSPTPAPDVCQPVRVSLGASATGLTLGADLTSVTLGADATSATIGDSATSLTLGASVTEAEITCP